VKLKYNKIKVLMYYQKIARRKLTNNVTMMDFVASSKDRKLFENFVVEKWLVHSVTVV